MKKLLIIFFLPLFFLPTIHSQKPFYHKNKEISWVGETEFTYYLEDYDRLNFEPEYEMQEETRSIKLDPFATCEFGNETYFTNFILQEVINGRRKITSTSGKEMTLTQVKNAFGEASIDTSIVYDVETMKETYVVTRIDPIYQVKSFKVRQWWYYDEEKESLNSMVKAIAPIMEMERKDGSKRKQTLFWIEMEQTANHDYSFNDPFVIWAKETLSTLSFDKVKKKKGRTKKTLKNLTYKDPKKGKIKTLENDSWYPYCADPIGKEEISELLSASVDTIITFDPETFTEDTRIVKNKKMGFKDFDFYRVLQHWYFDKSTNTLASKVISIGPLQSVYDEKGKLKYRKALYYIPSAQ